jgi:hypothetical protein
MRLTFGGEIVPLFSQYSDGQPVVPSNIERIQTDSYYYDVIYLHIDKALNAIPDVANGLEGLTLFLGSDDPAFADDFSAITDQASYNQYLNQPYTVTAIPADMPYGPNQAGLLNAIKQTSGDDYNHTSSGNIITGGPLQNALVFLDLNNNGVLDSGEASVRTAAQAAEDRAAEDFITAAGRLVTVG